MGMPQRSISTMSPSLSESKLSSTITRANSEDNLSAFITPRSWASPSFSDDKNESGHRGSISTGRSSLRTSTCSLPDISDCRSLASKEDAFVARKSKTSEGSTINVSQFENGNSVNNACVSEYKVHGKSLVYYLPSSINTGNMNSTSTEFSPPDGSVAGNSSSTSPDDGVSDADLIGSP